MVTSAQCLKKYGDPTKESNMTLWDIPTELEVGVIPKRLYCNKDMVSGTLSINLEGLIKLEFQNGIISSTYYLVQKEI
jgi:hypothetical protein